MEPPSIDEKTGDLLLFPQPGSTKSDGSTGRRPMAESRPEQPFPSEGNHNRLRRSLMDHKGSMESFTDLECWWWHAYDYGWRRVMLGERNHQSPIDPDGDWCNTLLVDQAEVFWRAKTHRNPPKTWSRAMSEDDVREECRRIPSGDLTRAEHEFLDPEVEEMAAKVRGDFEAFAKRSKRAMLGPYSPSYTAPAQERVWKQEPDDPALLEQARGRVGL